MGSYDAALELVAKLTAAGVDCTSDPRSATPPCVLVTPPQLMFDSGCGATATWALFCLAPATGNADAWQALDALLSQLYPQLPLERVDYTPYLLSPDNPSLPAYRVQFTQGVDV